MHCYTDARSSQVHCIPYSATLDTLKVGTVLILFQRQVPSAFLACFETIMAEHTSSNNGLSIWEERPKRYSDDKQFQGIVEAGHPQILRQDTLKTVGS